MIYEVKHNKKQYLPLLLLADEQESMIDRYLDRGTLYIWKENDIKAVCVITDEGNNTLEIKNLAVAPTEQRRGYGKKLIEFVAENYKDTFSILQVGTGDSPLTIPFYEACGFHKSHTAKNFFLENYDHPIIEGGKQLIDMIYLRRRL